MIEAQCLPAGSMEWAPGIVRVLKIKSIGLLKEIDTSLFVEPEGWNTVEIYVNGFSTSLPEEVQYEALRIVPGFENVRMFRPGYAIEYDYFPPTQLSNTLETKHIS